MPDAATLPAIRKRLRSLANAKDAAFLQRFFRTGPGEYGEGDKLLGIRVPATRGVAREFRNAPLAVVERLLHERWHEARLLAVILLSEAYKRGTPAERDAIYTLYMRNTKRVNNWDLVDTSAPYIVGPHLAGRARASTLKRLAKSPLLWERRIAALATFHYIKLGEMDDSIAIAELLLHDDHDLIHKAVGWMLREVGLRDPARLTAFLDAHAHEMPRTMLRYSLERLHDRTRKHYMGAREQRA
jgi:3-methyladenine DNA glycosylase AlkD